jgi:hypothetical protein
MICITIIKKVVIGIHLNKEGRFSFLRKSENRNITKMATKAISNILILYGILVLSHETKIYDYDLQRPEHTPVGSECKHWTIVAYFV